jgi:hypothetical protein
LGQKQIERSLHKAPIGPALGEKLARNLILLAIGCAVIAAVYTIAIHKPLARPQLTLMGSPTPEATTARLLPSTPLVVAETPATAPAATPVAVPPATLEAAPAATFMTAPAPATPLDPGQDDYDKPVRTKRSSHKKTHGHEQ